MKSYNHLYEKVYDKENLRKAVMRAAKGKRRKKKAREVLWCIEHADEEVDQLHKLLITETYSFRRHNPHIIVDGMAHKTRSIIKPDFRHEQILHHAIIQVLKPIIMKSMDTNCCGSVPCRGGTYGKTKVEKFIKKHPKDCKYCLKLDIKKFYQSINHDLLKKFIKQKIHDKRMLRLLFAVIDNYEDKENTGIPIGYYTSQWFGNWYLEGLDHYIKERLGAKFLIRYADDMVIFDSNKRKLHKMKKVIEKYLNQDLGLSLNRKWKIFKFDYEYIDKKGNVVSGGCFLDFMGYRFYRNRTTLRRSIMLRATRKARRIKKITWYNACQMISYLGKFRNTNTQGVFDKYINSIISVRLLRKKVSQHQRRLNNDDKLAEKRKHSETA